MSEPRWAELRQKEVLLGEVFTWLDEFEEDYANQLRAFNGDTSELLILLGKMQGVGTAITRLRTKFSAD